MLGGSAKLAEGSAEPPRPKMAEDSAEPARFGRTLVIIMVETFAEMAKWRISMKLGWFN